jgi:hypothetical protein
MVNAKGLMIIEGCTVLLALLLLSGCTALRIDMTPYYTDVSCPLIVVDQRPALDTIVGSDIDFTISPPLRDVLRSKLCRSAALQKYTARNAMVVLITRTEVAMYGFVGSSKMLTIEGSVETGLQRLKITSHGTIGFDGLPASTWPALLNSALDDFVKKIEEALSL